MKKIVFVFSMIVLLFSCDSMKKEKLTINEEEVVSVKFIVEGMTCTGCENTVNNSVSEIPGVVEVKASHTDGEVVVSFDQSLTSTDEISKVISEKNYQVKDYQKIEE